MKYLLGRKQNMSQIFRPDGTVVPVTYIEVGPCTVTALRTMEQDGYSAIQVGYGKAKQVAKPQAARANQVGPVAVTREVRTDELEGVHVGDVWHASLFEEGDIVDVIGTSKGRGFAGVVKRHGFSGQSATHGTKDQIRASGSIGAQGPQRVFRGMRMAGRMGGDRVTVKNLEVVAVDEKENRIAVKGALPGARGGLVILKGKEQKNMWT